MNPPVMAPAAASPQAQNAALFAQLAQRGAPPSPGGAQPMPGGPPGMPPQMAQGQGGPQQMPPGGAPPMQPGQSPMQGQGMGPANPNQRFTPQELGMLGRYGDTVVAHLTPGEMTVPPQVQTPQLMHALDKAFQQKGADPRQFTVGSGQSSHNPQTGMPEYNFLSSFLPMALGLAGSALVPGLGLGLSPMLASALGTGAGSALGGIIGGQNPMQALLGGAGAGLGSYGLGSMFGGASGAGAGAGAGSAAGETAAAAQPAAATGAGGSLSGMGGASPQMSMIPSSPMSMSQINAAQQAAMGGGAAAAPSSGGGFFDNMFSKQGLAQTVGGGLGGMIGRSLYSPSASAPSDSSSDERFPQPSGYGNWQDSLGQNSYKGPAANFKNYNAADRNSNRWNFYPPNPQPI